MKISKYMSLLMLLIIIPVVSAGLPSRICYPLATGAFCFNSSGMTGFTMDPNYLDAVFTDNGILIKTAPGVYDTITDNSAAWNNAAQQSSLVDVNNTLQAQINTKLTATEQRYNETNFILSINSTTAKIGNCAAGQVVQNTTLGGVQCISITASANVTSSGNAGYIPQFQTSNRYSSLRWKSNTKIHYQRKHRSSWSKHTKPSLLT